MKPKKTPLTSSHLEEELLETAISLARGTKAYHRALMNVTSGTAIVSVALAGSVGEKVAADAVRFENTTDFRWQVFYFEDEFGLDLTRPAEEQLQAFGGPSTFGQFQEGGYQSQPCVVNVMAPNGGSIGPVQGGYLYGIDAGTLIGPGFGNFESSGTVGVGYYCTYPYETLFNAYTMTYLAARFTLSDGTHYGWIGVEFFDDGIQLDVFAWGYETEAGVAIEAGAGTVPAPGTLAALAFGACVSRRSRIRKTKR